MTIINNARKNIMISVKHISKPADRRHAGGTVSSLCACSPASLSTLAVDGRKMHVSRKILSVQLVA